MLARRDGFFGLHLDLHPVKEDAALGADLTESNIERLLDAVKPDFVQYDCKGHPGYTGCPVTVGQASPGIVKDSLAIWRKVTRSRGVLLGIHYSGVIDELAARTYPEWARVDPSGNPDQRATSTFGPYVDELMIPQLKAIVEKYDIDFVWVDGECWGAELDYSPNAVQAWKRETGLCDPPESSSDPHWAEWKDFNRRQFERYLIHWVDALHEFRPELNVASNWAYTTMCPIPVKAKVDHLSGDFDPMLSADRARTEVRYLANCEMPWDLLSWGFDSAEGQQDSLKLPAQLMQEAAVVLVYGGGYTIYYLPTRSGYINDTIIETAAEVARFCRERQELCHRNASLPQVALLYSSESHLDRSDRVFTWWGTPLNELDGALHALLELHYSVDILSEHQLEPRLSEFPLVVIPDWHKLSDSFCEALLGYVERGGNLLLLGQRCAEFFQPYLGVEYDRRPENLNATLVVGSASVPAPGMWQRVIPTRATAVGYRCHAEGMMNRSSFMDVRDNGVSEAASKLVHREVAATMVNHGKGKIGAVYGPIPTLYFNGHHPFLRRFVGDIVKQLFPNPLVQTDAPACVDIALRTTPQGQLSVHMLNLSNVPVSKRRPFSEYVPSIGPITVRIRVDLEPAAVTLEPGGTRLEWSYTKAETGSYIDVKVPSLHIHGAVVIRE